MKYSEFSTDFLLISDLLLTLNNAQSSFEHIFYTYPEFQYIVLYVGFKPLRVDGKEEVVALWEQREGRDET